MSRVRTWRSSIAGRKIPNRSTAGACGRTGGRPVALIDRKHRLGGRPKAATTTIPILFITAEDPVSRLGCQPHASRRQYHRRQFYDYRPGGETAGVAPRVGSQLPSLRSCATRTRLNGRPNRGERGSGRPREACTSSFYSRKRAALTPPSPTLGERRPDARRGDPFFPSRRVQLVALAARHGAPESEYP